ncbi:hypothetical protein N7523_001051 [Penicillium sp. IBT 18751x]|nr:hypothetical protein N7523_001051 [Penicillium sp. IBT 18751x]
MSRPSLALTRRAGIAQDSQDSQNHVGCSGGFPSRRSTQFCQSTAVAPGLAAGAGTVSVCTHHDAEADRNHE